MKPKLIIGIDPDVDKSGFAVLDVAAKSLVRIDTFNFPHTIEALKVYCVGVPDVVVVVEAAWMVSSNWHLKAGKRAEYSAATGYKVGQNHQTGKLICEMCRHYGIKVVEHIPLRKCWKGKDRKITHAEIVQFVPGLPSRTNQEERDAALLAWCFANLPIRLKA